MELFNIAFVSILFFRRDSSINAGVRSHSFDFHNPAIVILIIVLVAMIIILIMRSNVLFRKRKKETNPESQQKAIKISEERIFESCSETIKGVVISISKLYFLSIINFTNEKRKELTGLKREIKELHQLTINLRKNFFQSIKRREEYDLVSGSYYVQVLDYLHAATNSLHFVIIPIFIHVDNNYPPLPKDQAQNLIRFSEKMSEFFNYSLNIIINNRFENDQELIRLSNDIVNQTVILKKKQIQYLKNERKGTKVSLVFLDIMTESKNLVLFITNVVQAQKEFVEHHVRD